MPSLTVSHVGPPPSRSPSYSSESQQEQTYKDESDAGTIRQTPDQPSQTPAPVPSEGPAPPENQEPPAAPETAEDGTAAAAAGDQGSDESPSKSPSKKKKKFRTPSFLKKSKKKDA